MLKINKVGDFMQYSRHSFIYVEADADQHWQSLSHVSVQNKFDTFNCCNQEITHTIFLCNDIKVLLYYILVCVLLSVDALS